MYSDSGYLVFDSCNFSYLRHEPVTPYTMIIFFQTTPQLKQLKFVETSSAINNEKFQGAMVKTASGGRVSQIKSEISVVIACRNSNQSNDCPSAGFRLYIDIFCPRDFAVHCFMWRVLANANSSI
jgi:hypothetical protein